LTPVGPSKGGDQTVTLFLNLIVGLRGDDRYICRLAVSRLYWSRRRILGALLGEDGLKDAGAHSILVCGPILPPSFLFMTAIL